MSIDEIKDKFRIALPHFRSAMAEARKEAGPDGMVGLGIIAVPATGAGRITARFAANEFFDDIAAMLGLPAENTEDEDIEVGAKRIVDMVRASGGRIVDEAVGATPCASQNSEEK